MLERQLIIALLTWDAGTSRNQYELSGLISPIFTQLPPLSVRFVQRGAEQCLKTYYWGKVGIVETSVIAIPNHIKSVDCEEILHS